MAIEKNETEKYELEYTGYYNAWEYDLGKFGAANLVALKRHGNRISIDDIPADERADVIRFLLERLDSAELCLQDEGIGHNR